MQSIASRYPLFHPHILVFVGKVVRVAVDPLRLEESMRWISYELRCRECGKRFGNQPLSVCDECFSPLEVSLRPMISAGRPLPAKPSPGAGEHVALPDLLPLPDDYVRDCPSGSLR